MSQAASRERVCRKAVVPADTREKAVMRGRRAPGIIRRPYQSFSSGHLQTPHMARTGMREGFPDMSGVPEGRHALLT